MVASLIHANSGPEPPEDSTSLFGRDHKPQLTLDKSFYPAPLATRVGPSATLIVAPVSLLSQWHAELMRCSEKGSLQPALWHGANRGALSVDSGVDVIITSYGTLVTEHAKTLKSGSSNSLFDSRSEQN
jgi:DNA repair protein RAD5